MNQVHNRRKQLCVVAAVLCMGAMLNISSFADDSPSVESKASQKLSPLATEGPEPKPITPPTQEAIRKSLERGIDHLLDSQRKNGAWGSAATSRYYQITAPVPGAHQAFRAAVSGLAVQALIESEDAFQGERREKISSAIQRGQQWLLEHSNKLRRAEPDVWGQWPGAKFFTLYNVWGHSYVIQAAVKLHQRAEGNSKLQSELKQLVEYHVDRLERCSYINGGWGYYDMVARTKIPSGSPIGFTTATVLIALKDAATLGVEFPEKLTKRALASILRQRNPDFSYAYGEYLRMYPRYGINRPAGSLGRSQSCNLAMRLYGDQLVTEDVLRTWLKRLIARNGWLSMSRKRHIPGQSPHFADFGVAGYFFYYGHYYAALCMQQLPEDEHAYYQGHLANILLPLQEKDGSWWDFLLYDYHKAAGTSMAVSTLIRCLD